MAKDASVHKDDLGGDATTLASLGLANGHMIFAQSTDPAGSSFTPPAAGAAKSKNNPTTTTKMTLDDLASKYPRINHQDGSVVHTCSVDRFAGNVFNVYVASTLGYQQQRMGILFGRHRLDRKNRVKLFVDFIYEPRQTGTADSVSPDMDETEWARVEAIAEGLGLQPVGWIFSHGERDEVSSMTGREVAMTIDFQRRFGKVAVALKVSKTTVGAERLKRARAEAMIKAEEAVTRAEAEGKDVPDRAAQRKAIQDIKLEPEEGDDVETTSVEPFQVSRQSVRLMQRGVVLPTAKQPAGTVTVRCAHDVMVDRQYTKEIPVEFFLLPLRIREHTCDLMCTFPVENRIETVTAGDLGAYLTRLGQNRRLSERLSDFHALLFVTTFFERDDIVKICQTVAEGKSELAEGHALIINNIASMT